MNETAKKLQEWVINKIKTEYAEDIDLLLAVKGHSVNGDDHGEEFDFYIPATERAYELAETFIIDGIGHDLYPRSWERMERNAALEEGQAFVLGNSEVIYARNEEVLKRYEELRARMYANLENPGFTHLRALEELDVAMNIYKTLMFEEKPYQIRLGAGLIMNHLNHGVSYLNGTYIPQKDIQETLADMKQLPENFLSYQEAMIRTESMDELKNLSYLLIKTTRKFIASFKSPEQENAESADFNNLADWYQELSLCWQRIYYYSKTGDYRNAFWDAAYLQSELNVVGAEFNLGEMDLMSAYDYSDLSRLSKRAMELEAYILNQFSKRNIKLNQYANVQEFLEAH